MSTNYRFDLAPRTWEFIRGLRGGTALFTMPKGPIKCGGAPQKIAYLAADWWRRQDLLDRTRIILVLPTPTIFVQPDWAEVLKGVAAGYGIEVRYEADLVEVDGDRRRATLLDTNSGVKETVEFDLLHAVPPQSAPDWLKVTPLADPASPMATCRSTSTHCRARGGPTCSPSATWPNCRLPRPAPRSVSRCRLSWRTCSLRGEVSRCPDATTGTPHARWSLRGRGWRRPDIRVLRGRCLAAGDGVTYWALGEILRDACGIALGEAGRVAQRKLRTRLHDLLSPHQSDVDITIHALAATAAIPMPGNSLDDAPPRTVDDALARAWPRFATAAAAGGPLIMVVEDLHWAGKPLLDMLVRLAARSTGPVVVLTTARAEFLEQNPGFGAASADVSMVSLRSLTEQASRELLDSLPRASAIDAQRRDEILARAEGNPYFLEQLVAHLADGGSGALPDTLHALLAARVDALPVPEKRLLQAAAVIGRVFWVEPLRGRLEYDIADSLYALETRGLILARPASSLTGQVEWAFKHALLRDVAYACLPAAQRARARRRRGVVGGHFRRPRRRGHGAGRLPLRGRRRRLGRGLRRSR